MTYLVKDDAKVLARGLDAHDACDAVRDADGHASIVDEESGAVVLGDTDGEPATLGSLELLVEQHEDEAVDDAMRFAARAHFDLLRAINQRAGHSPQTTPGVTPLYRARLVALDETGLAVMTAAGRRALTLVRPECEGTALDHRNPGAPGKVIGTFTVPAMPVPAMLAPEAPPLATPTDPTWRRVVFPSDASSERLAVRRGTILRKATPKSEEVAIVLGPSDRVPAALEMLHGWINDPPGCGTFDLPFSKIEAGIWRVASADDTRKVRDLFLAHARASGAASAAWAASNEDAPAGAWCSPPIALPWPILLTQKQTAMLLDLAKGDRHVRGRAAVGLVRALEARGLATLEDNGDLRPGGRVDGERWSASLTDAGTTYVKELKELRSQASQQDPDTRSGDADRRAHR